MSSWWSKYTEGIRHIKKMNLWNKFRERFPNANLNKFSKVGDNVEYRFSNGISVPIFDPKIMVISTMLYILMKS